MFSKEEKGMLAFTDIFDVAANEVAIVDENLRIVVLAYSAQAKGKLTFTVTRTDTNVELASASAPLGGGVTSLWPIPGMAGLPSGTPITIQFTASGHYPDNTTKVAVNELGDNGQSTTYVNTPGVYATVTGNGHGSFYLYCKKI